MDLTILFEDSSLMLICKPAGLVINRAESVREETLQDLIEKKFNYPLAKDLQARNGIVHRLDKDTSGVLVLAKTAEAMVELQRQFHDRETEKTYIALVHGTFSVKEGIVSVPMERSRYDRQKFMVSVEGRMTETHYKVLKEFRSLSDVQFMVSGYQGFSLVELHPKTGRTHQIRVIMTHLKHPLVGDVKYVGRKRAKADVKWCPRHFLHAQSLAFTHPLTRERMIIEAQLPDDLQKVLARLSDFQR